MGANVNLGYDEGKVFNNSPSINSNGDKFNLVTMEVWSKDLVSSETEIRALKIKNVDSDSEFIAIPRTFTTDTETTKGEWSKFHDFININETTSSDTVKLLANEVKNMIGDKVCLVKYDSAKSIYITPTAEDLSNAGVASWTPPQDSVEHDFVKGDKYLLMMPIKQNNTTDGLSAGCGVGAALDIRNNIDLNTVGFDPLTDPNGPIGPGNPFDPIEIPYREIIGPIVITGFQTTSVVKTCTGLDGEIISTQKTEISRSPIYNGCDNPPPPAGCPNCRLVGWTQRPLPGTPGDEGLRMIRVPIWRDYREV